MSKKIFREFFKHTLRWEGGNKLHKVEGDSGGWTLYGVAYNKNKHLFKDLEDFKSMTYERASDIAYNEYYVPIQTDKLPIKSQLMYFDMAYNMGNSRAIKILQRCLGLKQDGVIGKITLSKIHLTDLDCLYKQRNSWYELLKTKTSWASKFYKGWMNRSKDIYNKSKEINEEEFNNIIDNSSNNGNILDSSSKEEQADHKSAANDKDTEIKDRLLENIERWILPEISSGYPKQERDY